MENVRFEGWKPGLQKVALTKLLQKEAKLSLRSARECTNRLLEGEHVVVSVPTTEDARKLAARAAALGAVVGAPSPQAVS